MVIPSLQDKSSPLGHDTQDMRKFDGIEAITLPNRDLGLKPHFGIAATAFNVNMPWLARESFVREKEITQALITKDDRHFSPRANPP
jgi:hypothetical protein